MPRNGRNTHEPLPAGQTADPNTKFHAAGTAASAFPPPPPPPHYNKRSIHGSNHGNTYHQQQQEERQFEPQQQQKINEVVECQPASFARHASEATPAPPTHPRHSSHPGTVSAVPYPNYHARKGARFQLSHVAPKHLPALQRRASTGLVPAGPVAPFYSQNVLNACQQASIGFATDDRNQPHPQILPASTAPRAAQTVQAMQLSQQEQSPLTRDDRPCEVLIKAGEFHENAVRPLAIGFFIDPKGNAWSASVCQRPGQVKNTSNVTLNSDANQGYSDETLAPERKNVPRQVSRSSFEQGVIDVLGDEEEVKAQQIIPQPSLNCPTIVPNSARAKPLPPVMGTTQPNYSSPADAFVLDTPRPNQKQRKPNTAQRHKSASTIRKTTKNLIHQAHTEKKIQTYDASSVASKTAATKHDLPTQVNANAPKSDNPFRKPPALATKRHLPVAGFDADWKERQSGRKRFKGKPSHDHEVVVAPTARLPEDKHNDAVNGSKKQQPILSLPPTKPLVEIPKDVSGVATLVSLDKKRKLVQELRQPTNGSSHDRILATGTAKKLLSGAVNQNDQDKAVQRIVDKILLSATGYTSTTVPSSLPFPPQAITLDNEQVEEIAMAIVVEHQNIIAETARHLYAEAKAQHEKDNESNRKEQENAAAKRKHAELILQIEAKHKAEVEVLRQKIMELEEAACKARDASVEARVTHDKSLATLMKSSILALRMIRKKDTQ